MQATEDDTRRGERCGNVQRRTGTFVALGVGIQQTPTALTGRSGLHCIRVWSQRHEVAYRHAKERGARTLSWKRAHRDAKNQTLHNPCAPLSSAQSGFHLSLLLSPCLREKKAEENVISIRLRCRDRERETTVVCRIGPSGTAAEANPPRPEERPREALPCEGPRSRGRRAVTSDTVLTMKSRHEPTLAVPVGTHGMISSLVNVSAVAATANRPARSESAAARHDASFTARNPTNANVRETERERHAAHAKIRGHEAVGLGARDRTADETRAKDAPSQTHRRRMFEKRQKDQMCSVGSVM